MSRLYTITSQLLPHSFNPLGLLRFVNTVGGFFVIPLLKFGMFSIKLDVLVLDFTAKIFRRKAN